LATAAIVVADPGDAEKASQMLQRVVDAVHHDQNAALKMFSAGTDGFKEGAVFSG